MKRLFKKFVAAAAAITLLVPVNSPVIYAALNNADVQSVSVASYSSDQIFSDFEEAAPYLRSQIRNRTKNITISLSSSIYSGDLNDTIKNLFTAALAETGIPDEGDYMRFGIHGMNCSASINSKTIICRLTMDYFTTADQEKMTDQKISEVIKSLDLNGCSNYEKICRIYEYVINCAEYEYDQTDYPERYSAYGALFNDKAVCQGFSQLFYRLSLEAGVPCRIIAGSDHTWNIARIGSVYYLLDPTWDEFRTKVDQCHYFLKGTKDFDEFSASLGETASAHEASGDVTALRPGYLSEEFSKRYPVSDYAYSPETTPTQTFILGDVDENGIITGSDATIALTAYTKLSSFRDHGLTDTQFAAADANGDGIITGSDATLILNYYTLISSGYKFSMEDYISDMFSRK